MAECAADILWPGDKHGYENQNSRMTKQKGKKILMTSLSEETNTTNRETVGIWLCK